VLGEAARIAPGAWRPRRKSTAFEGLRLARSNQSARIETVEVDLIDGDATSLTSVFFQRGRSLTGISSGSATIATPVCECR